MFKPTLQNYIIEIHILNRKTPLFYTKFLYLIITSDIKKYKISVNVSVA
jgi:hypothetical protein